MKKLLSTLMITTVLGSVSYAPKSQAGVVLATAAVSLHLFREPIVQKFFSHNTLEGSIHIGVASGILGVPAIMAITFGTMLPGPMSIPLIVLSEDGSVSQTELESTLSQKYNFIADREVISTLAKTIKSKADSVEVDAQGLKMVSLSEDEVKSILAVTELSNEEIAQVVKDLGPVATAATEVVAEEKVNGMTFLPQAE